MSNCTIDRRTLHGFAQLISDIDTDVFENGIPEPWKAVGQRVRCAKKGRRELLQSELSQIAGDEGLSILVEVMAIDPTHEFETKREAGIATLPTATPFPVAAFPDILARYVSECARSVYCPPDYLAVPMLGFLGAAIGGTRRMLVKHGWPEQPNLYLLVVGPSGSKKTPASNYVSCFAEARSKKLADEFRERLTEYDRLHASYEDDLQDYRAHRRKHSGSPTSGNRPEAPDKPILSRTTVDDTTVEALQRILFENPRGVCMNRDELTGLLLILNQYKGGRGADGPFFLSAWSGKAISVDRNKLATPYLIPRPVLSIVGGIPPGVLPSVLGSIRLEDGMTARFLVSYPELMHQQLSEDVVSVESSTKMSDLFEGLYGLEPELVSAGCYEPRLVTMSRDAYTEFNHWQKLNNDRLNSFTEFDSRRAPIAKMPSQVARITLILHEVRLHTGEANDPNVVDAESVARAGMIANYFVEHVDRVWQVLSESKPDRRARQLLAWMTKQPGSVTRRHVVSYNAGGIRSKAEADEALNLLEEAGQIRSEKTPHTTRYAVVFGESNDA